LMRMINVNIFNTEKTLNQSISSGIKKYFCVLVTSCSYLKKTKGYRLEPLLGNPLFGFLDLCFTLDLCVFSVGT